ncbi:hypothetical protein DFH06DRAFT_1239205, partial [Mycena polygramma]
MLDATMMTTPVSVFETSVHVAHCMVKDTLTGKVLCVGHLVNSDLEARLEGDREARRAAATQVHFAVRILIRALHGQNTGCAQLLDVAISVT